MGKTVEWIDNRGGLHCPKSVTALGRSFIDLIFREALISYRNDLLAALVCWQEAMDCAGARVSWLCWPSISRTLDPY